MYRVQSFKIQQRDTKQLHRYLERQVSDEGEEGDGSVDVPPGSGHTGSAQHLPVPEPNTELQSHVRRRLPRCSTTTSQGDVEPDGGTRTIHTSSPPSTNTVIQVKVGRRCYLSGRGSTTPTTTTFFPGCIPPVMGPLNGTACTHTHIYMKTHTL